MFFLQLALVGMLVVALILTAVAERNAASATPTAGFEPFAPTASPGARAPLTSTPDVSTATAEDTPEPTDTPVPTPSPSPTPQREPILRTGSGDSVFYPQKWIGPAVVRITYDGQGPLGVWTQNDNGEREDQLANSAGPYRGDSLIDFSGSQRILRFEVRTAGYWQIEVLPLSLARHAAVPAAIDGSGSEAIIFDGPYSPDLLQADAPGVTGEFAIYAFGSTRVPLVQTIGPYAGTVPFPRGTTALAVKATGPWHLEVTTR